MSFFVACAVLGGGLLLAQLVLGAVGGDHAGDGHAGELDPHIHHASGAHAAEGFNLKSARALTAGLAFFGMGGLLGLELKLGAVSIVLAVALGLLAQVGTAAALRAMLRFEADRTLSIDRAIGQAGTVYLTIPAERSGIGKVHVTVQERLIECPAITTHAAIPTGTPVLVIDVDDERTGTLIVVQHVPLTENLNAVA